MQYTRQEQHGFDKNKGSTPDDTHTKKRLRQNSYSPRRHSYHHLKPDQSDQAAKSASHYQLFQKHISKIFTQSCLTLDAPLFGTNLATASSRMQNVILYSWIDW